MHYSQLSRIRSDLDSGSITMPDLVGHYLSNIENNTHLNAFLGVFGEEALDRAKHVQIKIEDGSVGKLAGMVIGIKDVICLEDHSLQCGSHILDGFRSQYTATAVQKLLNQDAIIIGRLNCDEFAMGSSNENSAFGPCLNPFDHSRVPGGSSGGSAVAVAADMCLAALGSDTGGSVRQPAAFCGVIGLKPTYSRISRYGLAAYASSFDTIGILSHSVDDAALLLELMAGHDGMDSSSSKELVSDYSSLDYPGNQFRIGVINQSVKEGIDEEIRQVLDEKSDLLKSQGHFVEEVDFKAFEYALPTYYILTTAEASTNLSRYDGVRYGFRADDEDLNMMYKKSRSLGFGEEVKRRILLGTFVLSSSYFDAYYSKAQKVRRIIQEKTIDLFKKYDFVMLPTAPTVPFKLGEHTSSLEMYLADFFTVQASVAGIPAISLPLGQTSSGLPIGIQVMSDFFTEHKLLTFSKYFLNSTIITAKNGH